MFPRIIAAGLTAALLTACASATKPGPKPSGPARPTPSASPTPMPTPVLALVPQPARVDARPEAPFTLTPDTSIYVPRGDARSIWLGRYLALRLAPIGSTGPAVRDPEASVTEGGISFILDPAGAPPGDEGYTLSVSSTAVRISARTPAGLFYGVQTLRQLLPPFLEYEAARPRPIMIPAVEIVDQPRFAWRGAMLDVARHFFGVEDVKRYLDLLALHKINRLHLHLSDDQGFRIEIKSWPNLTARGGRTEVGGTPGGFYTQAQYAELVAYAQERFITVVPEIDIPGHTNAALSSYAELNCNGVAPPPYTDIKVGFSALCVDSEVTYRFLDDVIGEIAALTPGPYFHVGGDEVKTLTPEQYSRFIARADTMVTAHGKRTVGWDEVADVDLPRAPIVQHWRPDAKLAAAAAKGATLIFSPANRTYLDMQYEAATILGLNWAGRIEVRDAYDWDPATLMEGVGEGAILGVEAPLWSETVATMADVESMAFPRLAAVAEIGWTPQSQRSWEDFRLRLGAIGPRWQAMGIHFQRSPQIPWR